MSVSEGERITVKEGEQIYRKGEELKSVCVLMKGRVKAFVGKEEIGALETGDIIGLSGLTLEKYAFDFIAAEECMLFKYSFSGSSGVEACIDALKQFSGAMVTSVLKLLLNLNVYCERKKEAALNIYNVVKKYTAQYKSDCTANKIKPIFDMDLKGLEVNFKLTKDIEKEIEYFENILSLPADIQRSFFKANLKVCLFHIERASKCCGFINEQALKILNYTGKLNNIVFGSNALFYAYSELIFSVSKSGESIIELKKGMEELIASLKGLSDINKEALKAAVSDYNQRISLPHAVEEAEDEPIVEKPKETVKASPGAFDINKLFEESMNKENTQKEPILEYDEEAGEEPKQAEVNKKDNFYINRSYTEDEILEAKEETKNSLERILEFSKIDAETADKFKLLIAKYGKFKDVNLLDDEVSSTRREISKLFYKIYENVFFEAYEKEVHPVIDMFLTFGYVDEGLLTEEEITELYYLPKNMNSENIFTLKEWLTRIYLGEIEPSKNEFDIDYTENLREIKRSRLVSKEEEFNYFSDQRAKVKYEIDNMFRSTNRMTFGKISTFSPVLCSQNITGSLTRAFVSAQKINEEVEKITKIDYALFYRECLYSDQRYNINNERIMKKVMPYYILMPNFGSRSVMWQEISGRKKDTPGRLMLPIFTVEDFELMMVTMLARFRWELCKSVQGVHWSNIEHKSITSEYYDYLQFYRKNREISEKAREKIKLMLQKKSNNYKECFVQDYTQWLKYEAQGAPRLNGYVRRIMFTYCPFPKEVRGKLTENPMFGKIITMFNRNNEAKLARFEKLNTLIEKNGGEICEELNNNLEFYKM